MVANRLRDLRKKDLGISSTDKLAELLGGEDAGWYHQKIQRIETGKTALTDEDAQYIATTLRVPISALFDESQLSTEETELVANYKNAPEHVQMTIQEMLKVYENEKG